MEQEKIGKFITELRKEKNMTQQSLADKLGVSNKTVGNWENGRNMPDLSLLKPLCNELGITVDELILGERIGNNIKKKEKARNLIADLFLETIEEDNFTGNDDNELLNTLIAYGMVLGSLLYMTNTMENGDKNWIHLFPGLLAIFIIFLPLICFKTFKKLPLVKKILAIILYAVLVFFTVMIVV